MKGISPKYLIIAGCISAIVLTLTIRSQLYERTNPPIAPVQPAAGLADQPAVVIHFHNRRPFYMSDGSKVFGLVIDPIERAFKTAGIPFVWRETPARRQLDIIERNEDKSCAAGWFKTPEREAYARYTLPIYRDKPFVAVARADNADLGEEESIDRVFRNRRLQLLVKTGYSYGGYIDERLRSLAPRQVSTTAENLNILRMIENYRADYSFMTEEEAGDLLLSLRDEARNFKLVHFSGMPPGGKRYIICSKKVGPEIIARLDAAIRDFKPMEDEE